MAKENAKKVASTTKTKTSDGGVTEVKVKTSKTSTAKTAQPAKKPTKAKTTSVKTSSKTAKNAGAGSKSTKRVLNIVEMGDKPTTRNDAKTGASAKKALVDYGLADIAVATNEKKKVAVAAGARKKPTIDGVMKSMKDLTAEYEEKSESSDEIDEINEEMSDKQSKNSKKVAKKQDSAKSKKTKIAIISVILVLVLALGGGLLWMLNRKETEYCKVSFESNGGSEVASVDVVCGEKLSEPENPTKEGFDFREWVYQGHAFDFNNDEVTDDIILVAKWDAMDDTEVVMVRFDTAGGSEIEDIEIAKGTAIAAPADPTRDGYTFKGWYWNDAEYDFGSAIDYDITLVAHWEPNGGTSQPVNNNSSNSQPSVNQNQPSTNNNTQNTGGNTNNGGGSQQTGGNNSDNNGYDSNEPDIPGSNTGGGPGGTGGEGGGTGEEGGDPATPGGEGGNEGGGTEAGGGDAPADGAD